MYVFFSWSIASVHALFSKSCISNFMHNSNKLCDHYTLCTGTPKTIRLSAELPVTVSRCQSQSAVSSCKGKCKNVVKQPGDGHWSPVCTHFHQAAGLVLGIAGQTACEWQDRHGMIVTF